MVPRAILGFLVSKAPLESPGSQELKEEREPRGKKEAEAILVSLEDLVILACEVLMDCQEQKESRDRRGWEDSPELLASPGPRVCPACLG